MYCEISSLAMIFCSCQVRIPVVLGFLEIMQNFIVRPSGVAEGRPIVIVLPVAPHIEHIVEDRGTSNHFSTRPVAPAIFHACNKKNFCFEIILILGPEIDKEHK